MNIYSNRLHTKIINEQNINKGWLKWVNDPITTKYLAVSPPVTETDLIEYIKENQKNNDLLLAVYQNINSDYIGNLRLYNINKETKSLMYGRMIGSPSNFGQGYGTEFLHIICYITFECLKLDFAYTSIKKKNISSKRPFRKISGGISSTLFAVDTTKTGDVFSANQVINVARTRLVVPLSPLL